MMEKILVVEDDTQLRTVLGRILRGEGYEVALAENGSGAIAHLQETSVDLVVTDLYMPDMDGIELVIHLSGAEAPCPVLAISGGGYLDSASALERATALGVHRTLAKPFSPWEFLEAVRQTLDSHEAREAEAEGAESPAPDGGTRSGVKS